MKKQIVWISPLWKDGTYGLVLKEVEIRPSLERIFERYFDDSEVLISDISIPSWEIGQIMGGN